MTQTIFSALVVSVGALATVAAALAYFRTVRLDRPAIGAFNSRDLVILAFFIVVLPVLYLAVPTPVLTGFLVLTFSSAMGIGLRPVLAARYRRVLIPVLIGSEIVVTYTLLGSPWGPQLYWALTSVIVLVAAMGVSNLYVQGGLRLRQVAWFALFLAAYDLVFSTVIPLTPKLADAFAGRPLDASIGWAAGGYASNIGLGDLLIYGLFVISAYKAFDRRGAIWGFITVFLFGAVAPSVAPLIVSQFNHDSTGIVIPAQLLFGPAAFVVARLLYRRHPERTTAQWVSEQEARLLPSTPAIAAAVAVGDIRPVERPVPVAG